MKGNDKSKQNKAKSKNRPFRGQPMYRLHNTCHRKFCTIVLKGTKIIKGFSILKCFHLALISPSLVSRRSVDSVPWRYGHSRESVTSHYNAASHHRGTVTMTMLRAAYNRHSWCHTGSLQSSSSSVGTTAMFSWLSTATLPPSFHLRRHLGRPRHRAAPETRRSPRRPPAIPLERRSS